MNVYWTAEVSFYVDVLKRLSPEGKRIIYCLYEYEPLLDSVNMTIRDYARIANDIKVSKMRITIMPTLNHYIGSHNPENPI